MKQLLLFIFCLLVALPMSAQNYERQWKKVQQAVSDDQPRTVVMESQRLYDMAEQHNNLSQMLRAYLTFMQYRNEISPDSFVIDKAKLVQWQQQTMDVVDRSVLSFVLGVNEPDEAKSYAFFCQSLGIDVPDEDKILLSLAQKKTSAYIPLVKQEEGSEVFQHDMLSFLRMMASEHLPYLFRDRLMAKVYQRDETFYREKGNAKAAVRVALEGWEQSQSSYNSLDEMIHRYGELEDLVIQRTLELSPYNKEREVLEQIRSVIARYPKHPLIGRLCDKVNQIVQPHLYAQAVDRAFYPGEKLDWRIESSNVQQVEIRWYRVSDMPNLPTAHLTADARQLKSMRKQGSLVESRVFNLTDKSFVYRSDTLNIEAPEALGYYLIEIAPLKCDEYPIDKAEPELCLVHVTRLMPYLVPVDGKLSEVWTLDRQSGHPIEGVQIQVLSRKDDMFTIQRQGISNSMGHLLLELQNKGDYLLLEKGKDKTLMPLSRRYYSGRESQISRNLITQLFTDRSLYRPGQEVQFSVMAYAQSGDDTHVIAEKELTIQLFESRSYKAIAELNLKTDELGVAAGTFTLPGDSKTGEYSIAVKGGNRTHFRVEEYKRPTFEVSWQPIEGEYALGDTIVVSGRAMTYSGVPVSMAQVNLKKTFRLMRWWSLENQNQMSTDTLYTDQEGYFTTKLILRLPEDQRELWGRMGCFARFVLDATVTSAAGESHEAQQVVSVSRNRFNLSLDYSAQECKERLSGWTANLYNSAGQPLNLPVRMSVRLHKSEVAIWEGEIESNKETKVDVFQSLPSGNYVVTIGYDTLNVEYPIKLFSLEDTVPVEETPLWLYAADNKIRIGERVKVQYGTSLQHAFVQLNIYNGQTRVHHEEVTLSNELRLCQLPYQQEWGDAVKLVFTLVKNGKTYQKEVRYELAAPDKELKAEWISFRDYLLPGQQETWTLRITQKGKPVEANLMATLYDASMDAIYHHNWSFHLNFHRSSSSFMPYHTPERFGYTVYFKRQNDVEWTMKLFDRWADDINLRIDGGHRMFAGHKMMSRMSAKQMVMDAAPMVTESVAMNAMVEERAENASEEKPQMEMRTNFQETAFFQPLLRTDKDGVVNIRFTLPESLTRWRMMGFAHSRQLDYTLVQNQVTARKQMMVQPQLPRFLRVGDQVLLAATVQNLTDAVLKGMLYVELTDSTLNTVVLKKNQPFEVPANGSRVLNFSYQVKDLGPSIVCKFYAKAGDFTDGEQHLLPVLSDKVWLTESRAVYLNDAKKTVDLSGMFHGGEWWNSSSSMTVETIHNPLWVAVESLETLCEPHTCNAVDLASAYYATAIGKMLMDKYPSLTQQKGFQVSGNAAETWLKQLQELQCDDGGFSWFKGMKSSPYITRMVVEPFIRLHVMGVPYLDKARYEMVIGRALNYLDAQALVTYRQMQKWEKESKEKMALSENSLHYLYLYSLLPHGLGKDGKEALDFFLNRLPLGLNAKNLYDKALACVIYKKNGKEKDASKQLQSLLEYTVYSDELGRYYDTDRSMVSWRNYRMPVQTLLMEALGLTTEEKLKVDPQKPEMETKQIRRELSQWLLNQRRTQLWKNSSTIMDALYALLLSPKSEMNITDNDRIYTKSVISSKLSPKMPKEWVIRRDSDRSDSPMSWVNVTMETQVPLNVVQSDAPHSGLKISRMFYVESVENGKLKYKPADLANLGVGQKVISRILLSADRDFDFVEITSNRASCMEPARQLSGYVWQNGLGTYYAVKDSESKFYVDRLPKGNYELNEELYITHSGTYQVGLTEVKGTYCPEFADHSGSVSVTVKE